MGIKFKSYGIEWTLDYGLEANGQSLSYQDIIELLHPKIKWLHEQDDDYQGDFYSCGHDSGKWYFIQGSFGSCSGCDWLQGLEDEKDARNFLSHFKNVVIQKSSKNEMIKYMTETLQNVSEKEALEKLIERVTQIILENSEINPSIR